MSWQGRSDWVENWVTQPLEEVEQRPKRSPRNPFFSAVIAAFAYMLHQLASA